MRVDVVTIFPDYLAPTGLSVLGRAQAAGLLEVRIHDLRAWTTDRHRSVDDTPYGGGAGMLMAAPPWGAALDDVAASGVDIPGRPTLIVLTPSGAVFTQAVAQDLSTRPWLVIACGRYEGIDARVALDARARFDVIELSIGDYVLAGGEAAALVVIEATARLVPGVLGNAESIVAESHSAAHDGLLEGPAYTKPPVWRDLAVPDVLLSGDHARIAAWRRSEAQERTSQRRPDLTAGQTYVQPPESDDRVRKQPPTVAD